MAFGSALKYHQAGFSTALTKGLLGYKRYKLMSFLVTGGSDDSGGRCFHQGRGNTEGDDGHLQGPDPPYA